MHRIVVTAAAGAAGVMVAAVAGFPLSAGAQSEPSLSLTPATVNAGDVYVIAATGCIAAGVPQEELTVELVYDFDLPLESLATDADGAADVEGRADASFAPELRIGGACVRTPPDGEPIVVFGYETQILTVVVPESTTPPSTRSAVAVDPRFTG